MIDFNKSLLFVSARSPFARRVRLAFLEHNIEYEEKIIDVFEDNPQLNVLNPLGRVPVAVLASGETLIDSTYILSLFYSNLPVSPLLPHLISESIIDSKWSAISLGLNEIIVSTFLESTRAKEKQDPSVFSETEKIVERVLGSFENYMQEGGNILGDRLCQADLDMGSALNYLILRFSKRWPERFPKSFKYLERLQQRPSFQKTKPPPA